MYNKFMQLLQNRQITAYKVAKDTGISNATLSDWKRGRATPKVEKLILLAKYFNVPIEFFLSDEEDE